MLDKIKSNVIITSKGGDEMNLSRYYLFLILILPIISFIFGSVLTISLLTKIFFYTLLAHVVIALYTFYSLFEITVLREKQGSKLTLSKGKITSDWS